MAISTQIHHTVDTAIKLHRRFWFQQQQTQKELRKIRAANAEATSKLANAINAVITRHMSDEEAEWVKRIESRRNELLASKKEIKNHNFTQNTTLTTTLGEMCRRTCKPHKWQFLLFKLIREFQPQMCLEMGSFLGIAGAYQAAALALNSANGRMITMEGAAPHAEVAQETFAKVGLDAVIKLHFGMFQDTLDDVLQQLGRVDYAYIDGHHRESAATKYFETIYPYLSEEAVVVFSGATRPFELGRFWSRLARDSRVRISVDTITLGICVFSRTPGEKLHFRLRVQ